MHGGRFYAFRQPPKMGVTSILNEVRVRAGAMYRMSLLFILPVLDQDQQTLNEVRVRAGAMYRMSLLFILPVLDQDQQTF